MKTFTYASAFAGIGGMTLGLKPLGGIGVAAWEYDPTSKKTQYAQDAHKLLHPEIPVYGDICKAEPNDLPDFDVFCFTPPCQAFSVAGKRGGFDDTRGTLTFEALRIAKEKKPKILFMENVKGLVNHDKGNTMSTIIHAINEIGYVVDFTVLNSKYFDVAQNRERVYLIAVREDLIQETPWIDIIGNTMLPKAKKRYQQEGTKTFNFEWPEQTEVRTRLIDFLEDSVDEKYYLSEDKTAALVAQLQANDYRKSVVEDVTCINPRDVDGNQTRQQDRVYETEGCMTTLQAQLNGRFNVVDSDSPNMLGHIDMKGMDCIKRVYDANTIGPTLTCLLEDGLAIKEATKKGYDIAKEGDAVNFQFPHSKTRRGRVGKQIANTLEASNINQGVVEKIDSPNMLGLLDIKGTEQVRRVYSTDGQAPTLTTMQGGMQEPKVYSNYRIRKLTPTECLRLQSIPNWAIEKLKENFSDSRLYKFAGNGLTTNVITAIGEKIVNLLEEIND